MVGRRLRRSDDDVELIEDATPIAGPPLADRRWRFPNGVKAPGSHEQCDPVDCSCSTLFASAAEDNRGTYVLVVGN